MFHLFMFLVCTIVQFFSFVSFSSLITKKVLISIQYIKNP